VMFLGRAIGSTIGIIACKLTMDRYIVAKKSHTRRDEAGASLAAHDSWQYGDASRTFPLRLGSAIQASLDRTGIGNGTRRHRPVCHHHLRKQLSRRCLFDIRCIRRDCKCCLELRSRCFASNRWALAVCSCRPRVGQFNTGLYCHGFHAGADFVDEIRRAGSKQF